MRTRKMKSNMHRYAWPDLIRGGAVLSMVAYHFTYDWVFVLGKSLAWFPSLLSLIWQQSIGWTFIFIAGVSIGFSKNSLRHGVIVFGSALGITFVTTRFMPSQQILFGVLHLIGLSILLISVLRPLLKDIPALAGLYLSLAVFLLFWPQASVSVAGKFLAPGSEFGWMLNPLGWPQASFFSADYYPLLPWFFLMLAGSFFSRTVSFSKRVSDLAPGPGKFLAIIGQYALPIYIIHQPVILLVLQLFQR